MIQIVCGATECAYGSLKMHLNSIYSDAESIARILGPEICIFNQKLLVPQTVL